MTLHDRHWPTISKEIAKIKQFSASQENTISDLKKKLEQKDKSIKDLEAENKYQREEIKSLREKSRQAIHSNAIKHKLNPNINLKATNTTKNPRTLLDIHLSETNYSSDKWESYFNHYTRRLEHYKKYQNLRVLEIGVQNGGSLQCWNEYFEKKASIVGIDIDHKTTFLDFPENIKSYIGDATDDEWVKTFKSKEKKFDIIIDDGSHQSGDIIKTFSLFLKKLNYCGTYIIEDMHASYWKSHTGAPPEDNKATAMQFFKEVADYINREHWLKLCNYTLERSTPLLHNYITSSPNLKNELDKIVSIEFCNSLVFIIKKEAFDSMLGERVVSNGEKNVDKETQKFIP